MPIQEIEIKRKCKKCNKFHYKKTFKFDDYANIDEFILNIEWELYKIDNGYYKDNFCKYSFKRHWFSGDNVE